MNKFNLFTLIISSTIFIVLFTYSAVIFYTSKKDLFPPDMAPCPDNWRINPNGTCKIPPPNKNANLGYLAEIGVPIYMYKNIGKTPKYSYLDNYYDPIVNKNYDGKIDPKISLGYYTKDIPYGYNTETPEIGEIDFTHSGWASYGDPYCAIKKWSKIQNIQWDGMSSYDNGC